ncbi:LptA/OstA family protein [Aestuariivirga litoralis]|uniref:LptA/OstA family protein n=1 Tax=Aestuariivirga litoralis TaxID=2650924 RepID=UPI0018C58DD3|nr:LptA/OstA family protein [Aestuariivirga litoralis]MBG1232946.1 hypothetical protein [Aestuariivirga litoralis]
MALRKLILIGVAAGFVSFAGMKLPAHAASSVDVEADQMEIIDAEHKTIFTGNVVAKRPSDTIKASSMVVTSSDQKQADGTMKNQTDFVDAKGDVTVVTKNAVITGEWAKFDVQNDSMVVGGNVKLVQGTSTVLGQRLQVNTKTNRLQMSGGRVSGSFLP